jgi:hypothetical protein
MQRMRRPAAGRASTATAPDSPDAASGSRPHVCAFFDVVPQEAFVRERRARRAHDGA